MDGRIGWKHYYSHCELKLIAQSYSASYSALVMTGSEFGLIKELENKGIENSGKVNTGLVENKYRTGAIETNRPSSFHEMRYAGCINRCERQHFRRRHLVVLICGHVLFTKQTYMQPQIKNIDLV